jgi:surfeit locus 1 family protein
MFKPKLIPTLVTVPCLLLVIALGIWQVQRMQWKEELLANLSHELDAAPTPLNAGMLADGLPPQSFRHVEFEAALPAHIPVTFAAKYNHGSLGYHVISLMELKDGGTVLVNRGWIPQAMRDTLLLEESRRSKPDEITVTGLLRPLPRRGWFIPDNNAADNMWFWYDAPAIATQLGMGAPPQLVVEATAISPKTNYPMPAKAEITLRNDHLMYALTWFGMALALVVIYVVYHLQLQQAGKDHD